MKESVGKAVRLAQPPAASEASEAEPVATGSLPVVSGSTRARLVRLAYRFLWNQDDAEDAVQDALTVAQERHRDLKAPERWWSWLCRVVVQRCHLQGRSRQRHTAHAEPYARHAANRAEGGTASAEDKELLRFLLPQLPRRQQEVVVLRHLQQMSYEKIGEVLGIAPSTARVHCRAGLERLKELLYAPDPFETPRS